MKNLVPEQVIGVPITSGEYPIERSPKRFLPNPSTQYHIQSPTKGSPTFKQNKNVSATKRADNFTRTVREHVRLGPNISETLKGKLSLGVRILQVGGVEKVFKQLFNAREGEKLFKASHCYLSTTAGPIAGLLFVSTDRVAFCSDRSIKLSTPQGNSVKIHYKVMIPLKKIRSANQSVNMKKPSEKYIEIVTKDNFDFWFMGFLNYHQTFKFLQQRISQA